MHYIDVAPSRPLGRSLTYFCDELLAVGTRVEIPIGNSKCYGFVVSTNVVVQEGVHPKKIINVCNGGPYFSKEYLEFYKWVSEYYHYPLGETLSLITPSFIPKKEKKDETNDTFISSKDPLVDLTKEQLDAISSLRKHDKNLLHGITGSGKTEVYIEIAKDTISKGKGVLLIVPEIALTPQLIQRISSHFGGKISVLHSGLSPKKRYQNWKDLLEGKSLLCIGARSAVFAPIKDLGLVIVDEEQDSSYKQEDRLRYNARDLSFVLSKMFNAKMVLSSATPSIETLFSTKQGKLNYVYIKNRVRGLCLPSTVMVDMKKAKLRTYNMSEELVKHISEAISNKHQVILYINRRGFAHSIICKTCGKSIKCSKCSITMTEHKKRSSLLCHYCGEERGLPNYCPFCGSHDIYSVGTGTERILAEIKELFPNARVAIMDSDQIDSSKKLSEMLNKISNKELDIIIGTQILGKGHDFPDVNLVGIINTDTMLQVPDFRSAERTFHQITQVSGRAGRMCQGKVVVQSYLPEHFAIQKAIKNDLDGFYEQEIEDRKDAFYPPFAILADIKTSSSSKKTALAEAKQICSILIDIIKKEKMDVVVLGPVSSPIEVVNNKFRFHALIKGKSRGTLNRLIRIFDKVYKRKRDVRLSIDVDPANLI